MSLLVDGALNAVPGVTIVGPHEAAWAHTGPGDGRPRTNRPNKVILHKTKADDPEHLVDGVGPLGRAERVSEYWADDPIYSGAQVVVGGDFTACLADVIRWEAFHAGVSQVNADSIGIEHCEEQGGIVYSEVLANGVKVCRALAELCGIQLQVPRLGSYRYTPMRRFVTDGGKTLVGFFGHRDVTHHRGKWDPGECIFAQLIVAGAEQFDFESGEDLQIWKARQVELNRRGHKLVVDGIPGPATTAALKAEGYRGGVFALGKG